MNDSRNNAYAAPASTSTEAADAVAGRKAECTRLAAALADTIVVNT